jgi:hypothetical protein
VVHCQTVKKAALKVAWLKAIVLQYVCIADRDPTANERISHIRKPIFRIHRQIVQQHCFGIFGTSRYSRDSHRPIFEPWRVNQYIPLSELKLIAALEYW